MPVLEIMEFDLLEDVLEGDICLQDVDMCLFDGPAENPRPVEVETAARPIKKGRGRPRVHKDPPTGFR
jgi:hypothetical protein